MTGAATSTAPPPRSRLRGAWNTVVGAIASSLREDQPGQGDVLELADIAQVIGG